MTLTGSAQQHRPVIALMGEFSAGKSTLTNMLLGEGRSPVKVTATQLPPVWFSHGTGDPVRVLLDGTEEPLGPNGFDGINVEETAHVRVFVDADLLELMDIIDMPGNSDPNMSAEVWQRAVHHAHGVIWCSHATQAWRQSEAAAWAEMPEEFYAHSLLLLTRFDKIIGERDRMRVVRRVENEAEDLFRGVYPISLLQAMASEEDRDGWVASGADTFTRALVDLVLELTEELKKRPRQTETRAPRPAPPPAGDAFAAPDADVAAGMPDETAGDSADTDLPADVIVADRAEHPSAAPRPDEIDRPAAPPAGVAAPRRVVIPRRVQGDQDGGDERPAFRAATPRPSQ